MLSNNKNLIRTLKQGGITIIPTDTIYGLVGSALKPETVERIYKVRRRKPQKPMIILIGSLKDLELFSIKLNKKTKEILERLWPGKVSIILPCPYKKFSYLHRGKKSLAFRLPNKPDLAGLLKKVGPLVAPSANPEGLEPAKNITEAKKYFGKSVDIYINEGRQESKPSTLILAKNGKIKVLREGAVKIKDPLSRDFL